MFFFSSSDVTGCHLTLQVSSFDDFLLIMEKAVFTLCSITLPGKKIKSNDYQSVCFLRLINILVLFWL